MAGSDDINTLFAALLANEAHEKIEDYEIDRNVSRDLEKRLKTMKDPISRHRLRALGALSFTVQSLLSKLNDTRPKPQRAETVLLDLPAGNAFLVSKRKGRIRKLIARFLETDSGAAAIEYGLNGRPCRFSVLSL